MCMSLCAHEHHTHTHTHTGMKTTVGCSRDVCLLYFFPYICYPSPPQCLPTLQHWIGKKESLRGKGKGGVDLFRLLPLIRGVEFLGASPRSVIGIPATNNPSTSHPTISKAAVAASSRLSRSRGSCIYTLSRVPRIPSAKSGAGKNHAPPRSRDKS